MITSTIPAFDDDEMAFEIKNAFANNQEILIVAKGTSVLLARRKNASDAWTVLGEGDFDKIALQESKSAIKAGILWWAETSEDLLSLDLTTIAPAKTNASSINTWIKNANKLAGIGRGVEAKDTDKEFLGYLAGWRCQFSGCGKNLRQHSVSGSSNKSSYFAHIVASSPEGPRGDPEQSHKLSKNIENYLVLCDECHRRIDRTDPRRFSVDVLRKMRESSIAEVARLLSTLQYREAIPIVLMGRVFDQAPHYDQREAEEGMWTRGLRLRPGHPHRFLENGWHLYDPHKPDYWIQLFASIKVELPELRKLTQTSQPSQANFHLAIFVLHGTSIQILAGRLFGEASSLSIFQYRRNRLQMVPNSHWVFDDKSAPDPSKYVCKIIAPGTTGPATEAILLVSLSFKIGHDRLPTELYESGELKMRTLEVAPAIVMPNYDIIANEDDLNALGQKLEQAIKTLQDEWKVKKVHLIVGAPSSACFKLGQKMQAGYHAIYRCYETTGGPSGKFAATIEIHNTEVVSADSTATLDLR